MSKNLLKFLIIVKAKRRNGVYIALDMEQGKFIKPALRDSTSTWLSKDPDLQIGEEHLFEKSRDPLEISHPHGGGTNVEDFNGECFHEHTRCPSVGIYRCKRKHLNTLYNTDQSEQRCKIMDDVRQKPFSFRITVINDELPAFADEGDVLVILGLAKTYRGSSCQYIRWQRYILVIGVFSLLAAHILHCIFNSKFSQRVNTVVS